MSATQLKPREASEAAELPVGYRAIPFAPGLTEIAGPGLPLWFVLFAGGLGVTFAAAGTAATIAVLPSLASRPFEPTRLAPLLFAVIGVALIVGLLIKKTWVVGNGTVAEHYRVRLLGGSRLREFRGARAFAIVHAVWTNGWGSSDALLLLTEGDERIQLRGVQNQYQSRSADKPGPIETVVLGLGRYLSWRSGLPLSVREYGISPPSQ